MTTILITPTHQLAYQWCRMENDPPMNPRDRELIICTADSGDIRLRGRQWQDGDKVVEYAMNLWPIRNMVQHNLDDIYRSLKIMKTT